MGTKTYNNYEDLLTFTRASGGHALRPVSYGDEIFANNGFDDTSEWTLALDSISISSGKLIYDASNNIRGAEQQVSVEAGKIYQLSFEVLSGTARLYLSEGYASTSLISDLAAANYGVGKHVVNVVANGSYDKIGFSLSKFSGGTACEIDDFSLKEVTFDESDGTLTLFEHPNNIPRVEYDSDGNRLGLLVEEARTNNLTYSNGFTESIWTNDAGTTTANEATAPDRTNTAFSYTPDTTNSRHRVRLLVGSANAGNVSASVFVKANGASHAAFQVEDKNTGRHTVVLNFNSASIVDTENFGSPTVVDAGVSEIGNGWYRVYITLTQPATGFFALCIGAANSDSPAYLGGFPSYAGDGTSGVYIYGAQLEEGSFPTSYIKTTGSTATRSADVATMNLTEFGYNHSEGTVVVDASFTIDPNGSDFPRVFEFNTGTSSIDRTLIFASESSNTLQASSFVNSVGQVAMQVKTSLTSSVSGKIAFAFANDDFAASDDGDAVVTDTSGSFEPSVKRNKLTLGGSGANASSNMNGHIKSFKYYPRRLTNAQLQDLTS